MADEIILPNTLSEKDLIEFELFSVKNESYVNDKIILANLEASEECLNFMLRQTFWRGYSYEQSGTNNTLIGYGTSQETRSATGLTEKQAYSYWVAGVKESEKKLKRQFPLDKLTQSQYDGMVSLYHSSGSFTSVGSDVRKFQLGNYIKKEEWNYVATALINSGTNRARRQAEAKIIMLGDYGIYKDRSLMKEAGIQDIRKNYPDNIPTNIAKNQAEFVYYAETGRFLPQLTMSRMRELVKLNS